MSTIITSKFKIHQAERFKSSFSDAAYNLYLFVGKSDPWPNDTNPPTTLDTVGDDNERWNQMIALKKVVSSDVSHGIPLLSWDATGQTKYIEYSDNDPNLFFHPTEAEVEAAGVSYTPGSFYCVTDDYNVYKCISNGGFVKSTQKPTGTSTSIIELADGYKWKYMYTVSTSDYEKWKTDDFIPVKVLASDDGTPQWDVQAEAVDGSIEHIKVTAGGSGYIATDSGTAQSGGSNTITLRAGASEENDYYNGCMVFIEDGTPTGVIGQYRTISDYDGNTKQATLDSAWSVVPDNTCDYVVTHKLTVAGGGGTGLVGRVFTNAGAITKIGIVAKGSGYRFSNTLTLTISGGKPSVSQGTGATVRAAISPPGGHGKNAVEELGGFYSITYVKLNYDESDFITKNDYRMVGLIANVLNWNTTTLASASTLSATKSLTCNSLLDSFDEDEEIVGSSSGARAIIVESTESGSNATIRYYQNGDTGFTAFTNGETVTGEVSGATATITALNNPEIQPYKGRILHIEQRRPLMRSSDQFEDFKVVVEH